MATTQQSSRLEAPREKDRCASSERFQTSQPPILFRLSWELFVGFEGHSWYEKSSCIIKTPSLGSKVMDQSSPCVIH